MGSWLRGKVKMPLLEGVLTYAKRCGTSFKKNSGIIIIKRQGENASAGGCAYVPHEIVRGYCTRASSCACVRLPMPAVVAKACWSRPAWLRSRGTPSFHPTPRAGKRRAGTRREEEGTAAAAAAAAHYLAHSSLVIFPLLHTYAPLQILVFSPDYVNSHERPSAVIGLARSQLTPCDMH
eukprot:1152822-Pelagomonas_calceolata.AAC.2